GTPDGLAAGAARAQEIGVRRVTPLNVGGAFHTPLMDDASAGLVREVAGLAFLTPSAPIVSNDDAVAYSDADGWRVRLPRHVSVPVRWRSTMDTLVGLGATTFLEVGHGSMLAALAKRGAPSVTVHNVATPEDIPHSLSLEVG
ncbi:MAG: ACP S-malonyltransferase, partial [Acidimicrobiia bacterium]